jgi:hypothetical protein
MPPHPLGHSGGERYPADQPLPDIQDPDARPPETRSGSLFFPQGGFPGFLLTGTRLLSCEEPGRHWNEIDTLTGKVKKEELSLFLSMALSRFPTLGIRYEGYRVRELPPKTAVPVFFFRKSTRTATSMSSRYRASPGILRVFRRSGYHENRGDRRSGEKQLSVADVVFPRSPLTEFRELLRKSGKTVRDQVAEEEGRFIFSPEYAREFLEKIWEVSLPPLPCIRRKPSAGTGSDTPPRPSGSAGPRDRFS